MRNLPVFWHEGMFLRPQHFQAADRYWTELNEVSQQLDHPYYYGLRSLSLSEVAIGNNQFQINACRARLKDGTIVNLELGQEPDRLDMRSAMTGAILGSADLTEAFDESSKVRVFLAVPRLKLGRLNVGRDGAAQDCRYLPSSISVQDETDGSTQEEVDFLAMNTRLLLSTQSHAGYEVLPVAQVKRAGADSVPEIDPEYIPPLLAVEAWPLLKNDFIRFIYDYLGLHMSLLSEQVTNLDAVLASHDPGEMKKLLRLSRYNEAYAAVSSLAFAAGVHPFTAYAELCRAIGQLSLFGKESSKAPEFPRYDHDNLYPIFKWIKDTLKDLIEEDTEKVHRRFFVGIGGKDGGMEVQLDPQWLAEGWNWYIGVNRGILSESEVRELLKPNVANWKFGSATMVGKYFEFFHHGLKLEPVLQVPPMLAAGGQWVFYRVQRDNETWPHVLKEQRLGMRLQKQLIANIDRLQGKPDLAVTVRGQTVILQFALFAVPPLSAAMRGKV